MPIPRKKHGARTPAPVGFLHRNHRLMRQVDLILQHARGPKNAQQVDALRIAQPDKNLRRRLRLVARRAGQLPLLPVPARKHLHLHASRRLVVRKARQIEPHKMVLVRAHIAQQHRRGIQLRHNQIRRAVSVHIGSNQPPRRLQFHAVKPQRAAHILKGPIAAVAKHAHLGARPGLHNRRQVDPSIVVNPHPRSAPCSGSSTRSKRRPT